MIWSRLTGAALLLALTCAVISPPPAQAVGDEDNYTEQSAVPPEVHALYQAGKVAVDDERWEEGLTKMERVVKTHPKHAGAWNLLGYCRRHLGDLSGSMVAYERALQIDPTHRGAHEYMGELFLMLGRPEMARSKLRLLDSICPSGCEERDELAAALTSYLKTGRYVPQH